MARLSLIMIITLFFQGTGNAQSPAQPAPAFTVTDISGTPVTSDQYQGTVLLLAFWAPWCIPCREEMPALDLLYRKYKNKGFAIIGICEDAAEPAVAAFLKKTPLSFPLAIDPRGSVAEAYRLTNLPTAYLIGRDGMIKHRYRGFDKKFVQTYENDIRTLLDQQLP